MDGVSVKKIRFDGTVNAGHILSLIAFLVSGFVAWSTLDKRVVVLEEARRAQIERDEGQDRYLRDRIDLLSKGQDQIQRSIERLADKFDGSQIKRGQ